MKAQFIAKLTQFMIPSGSKMICLIFSNKRINCLVAQQFKTNVQTSALKKRSQTEKNYSYPMNIVTIFEILGKSFSRSVSWRYFR